MGIEWLGSTEWKKRYANGDDWQRTHLEGGQDPLTIGVRKLITPDISVKEEGEEEDRSIFFTISSNSVDRDGDTVKQSGWELENYKKNPVVLWAHDSRSPPVARASDIEIKGSRKLVASAEFVPADISPFADMVYRMYREKFLNATSVGFIPLDFDLADEDEDRGGFMPLDIKRQELLEFSAVPVPSNPDALVQARSIGIDTDPLREWAEETLDQWNSLKHRMPFGYKEVEAAYRKSKAKNPTSTQVGSIVVGDTTFPVNINDSPISIGDPIKSGGSSQWVGDHTLPTKTGGTTTVDVSVHDARKQLEKDMKGNGSRIRLSGPITWSRAHPDGTEVSPKDDEWSGTQVRQNLPEDQQRWLRIFGWFDSNADDSDEDGLPDDKSAWKLPHHKAEGDNPVVWRGVVGAMAALMGARGGVDVPAEERRSIYNHLARHYREDFDETPPEFEAVENQVLASEDYVMNAKTGRPEPARKGEADATDETDLALEQVSDSGDEAAAEASEEEEETSTVEEPSAAADAGGYEVSLQLGNSTVTCKVNTIEEMNALLEKFGGSGELAAAGTSTGDGGDDTAASAGDEGEGNQTKEAVEQAVEELDFDSLIEKYGEDEVLEMLPSIAEEVVDSILDQATGKVH